LTQGLLDPTRALITPTLVAGAIRVDIVYPAGSITGFSEVIVPANVRASAEMRRR